MKPRTSETHPLQIAALDPPAEGSRGMTFCPGKRDPAAMTGPWDQDLLIAFEDAWETAGAKLRRRLRDGERIVIHCLGGLGRTVTTAARLLIELGETPVRALDRVRAARPGAVETGEQERYVLGLGGLSLPST